MNINRYKLLSIVLTSLILIGTIGFFVSARNTSIVGAVPGFELIPLTTDGRQDLRFTPHASMNDCGEVVWSRTNEYDALRYEIFFYDNGKTTQITDNNVRDALPKINNRGDIIWGRGVQGSSYLSQVVYYADGQETVIRENFENITGTDAINNQGHITWVEYNGGRACQVPTTRVMFYDGNEIHTLVDDKPYSYYAIDLNDNDEMTYTQYDWCDPNYTWAGNIFYHNYNTGEQISITGPLFGESHQHQLSAIDPDGNVFFNMNRFYQDRRIAFWEKSTGEVTELTDGTFPEEMNDINNQGDVAFWRWIENQNEMGYQSWVYFKDRFYQLMPTARFNFPISINNYGETVIQYNGDSGYYDPLYSDVWLMQRIRTGDMDQDLDVDINDFDDFTACYTGSGDFRLCSEGETCRFADIDHDRDVDCDDWTEFKDNWDGQGSAPRFVTCDGMGNNGNGEQRDPIAIWRPRGP